MAVQRNPDHMSFILLGETGTGKTSQFLTFPGKRRFAQLFDPSALATLEDDVEYETWFPSGDMDIGARTGLSSKGKTKDIKSTKGPQVYNAWAEDFNRKVESGFFNDVDAYMLDSGTMLGWHCLERVRWMQDSAGRADERVDYRVAGEVVSAALSQVLSLPCNVLVTMHPKTSKSESGVSEQKFGLPGGSTLLVPRMAGVIWHTEVTQGRYEVVTQQDRLHPNVRNCRRFARLPARYDVTIKDFGKAREYGIGGLLKWRST